MVLLFAADDKFADVIAALEARGWRRLPHVSCPKFQLKWTNYNRLKWGRVAPTQIVNHLQHAVLFSRKDLFTALLYSHATQSSVRDLQGPQGLTVDAFFPRTFDLSQPHGLLQLKRWFLYSQAVNILKQSVAGSDDNGGDVDVPLLASAVAVTRRVLAQESEFESWWLNTDDQGVDSLTCGDNTPETDVISRHEVHTLLQQLADRDPQFETIGASSTGNVWICKPANLSQGRGILLTSSWCELEKLVENSQSSENQQGVEQSAVEATTRWIVQKYIERPLLLQRGRKFDVRQWILITALEPQPKVFWYHRNYLRFCTCEFSLTRLQDRFTHLSNYSVQREFVPEVISDVDKTGVKSPFQVDENTVESMWSSDRFRENLRQKHGHDVWRDTLVPQMEHAARHALHAVLPKLQSVGRGFEWLGFDFLVDESHRVWLLEVNVSPDVSHSTDVTAEMVPKATEDALILVLDPAKPRGSDNGWLPFEL